MKSKKILLGSLSTMALVATPIAAVVSCGDDASATKDTKIVKSAATGFVVEGVYIPADLASKAGEVTAQGSKLTWTEALKADAVVKFTAKGTTKAEDKKAKKADADHFVLPLKGLNGVGVYGTKATTEAAIEGLLNSGDLNLTLTPKESGKELAQTELDKLNTFAKATGSVATKIVATIAGDKTTFTITWTPAAAKKDDKTPAVTGSTQADLEALKTAIPATTATATTTSATTAIALKTKAEIKATGTAMTADQLVAAINTFIKAGSTFLAKPGTLNDALIKNDISISAEITTAAGAASGVLTLTFSKTGLTDVTTTITITK